MFAIKTVKSMPNLLAITAMLGSAALNAQVLPRDLDQDPNTIEAYYDPEFDVTAIAHPNLPWSENFGIPPVAETSCLDGIFCGNTLPGIDRYGFMEWPTADKYIDAMNAANYLGQSSWRLPKTGFVADNIYGWLGDSHDLDGILGARYEMQLPARELFNYRFITSTRHPAGGRAYIKWGSAYALGIGPTDGLTRFAVWPLLDGDVGDDVSADAQQFCADDDGDGHGWNGTSTCVPQNYSTFAQAIKPLEPRDLDNDPTTAEAYYHPQMNITWMADSRVALSNPFGFSNEINTDGSFDRYWNARGWMNKLNESKYLGHSQWRFPLATDTYENRFSNRLYDSELEMLAEHIVRLTSGSGENFEMLSGNYFVSDKHRTSGFGLGASIDIRSTHAYALVDEINYSDSYFAWPVHDGDIGTAVTLKAPCIDSDNDGWGWDGTDSCIP